MNPFLIDMLFTTLPPYIIGAAIGVLGTFVTGFAKEFFYERARRKKHKLEIARQVLKICNEASTGNYLYLPRDMEHVNSVLTDLEGINKSMSVEMEEFISSWRSIRPVGDVFMAAIFEQKQLDRADEKRKILIAWANKIRTGK